MAKIIIDEEKCIGCGLCESLCPKIFKMRNGKAEVKEHVLKPCVKESVDSCPTSAIEIK